MTKDDIKTIEAIIEDVRTRYILGGDFADGGESACDDILEELHKTSCDSPSDGLDKAIENRLDKWYNDYDDGGYRLSVYKDGLTQATTGDVREEMQYFYNLGRIALAKEIKEKIHKAWGIAGILGICNTITK